MLRAGFTEVTSPGEPIPEDVRRMVARLLEREPDARFVTTVKRIAR